MSEFDHFVKAQNYDYNQVVCELKEGQKRTHWMWYIFPQLRGLGFSAMSNRYALSSIAQACRYLKDELLGVKLRECSQLVLDLYVLIF